MCFDNKQFQKNYILFIQFYPKYLQRAHESCLDEKRIKLLFVCKYIAYDMNKIQNEETERENRTILL